jgi:hypothetical protein
MSERVVWLSMLRGGVVSYDVPAIVLRRTAKRVHIRVLLSTGELVERDVHPENVSPAENEFVEQHAATYGALEHDRMEGQR